MNYQAIFSLLLSKHEYLDPGSGSMLIQLVIGAVLGLGVFLRVFWKNIKKFFSKGKDSIEEAIDPTSVIDDPTQVLSEAEDTPKDTTI